MKRGNLFNVDHRQINVDSEGRSAPKHRHGDSPSQGTHKNMQTSVAKKLIFGLSGPSSPTPLGSRFSTLGATSNKLATTGFLHPSATASSSGVSGASAIGLRSPTLGPTSATASSSVRSGSLEGTSAFISSATSTSAVKPSQAKRSVLSVSRVKTERTKVDRTSFKRSNISHPSGSPLSNNNFGGEIVMDFLSGVNCEEGDIDKDLNQIRCEKGDTDIDLDLNQSQCEKGDIDINLFNEINVQEGDEENSLFDFDPNDVHYLGKSQRINRKRGLVQTIQNSRNSKPGRHFKELQKRMTARSVSSLVQRAANRLFQSAAPSQSPHFQLHPAPPHQYPQVELNGRIIK